VGGVARLRPNAARTSRPSEQFWRVVWIVAF